MIKKGGGQIMSENINPMKTDKNDKKIREGAKHLFQKIDKKMIKKERGGQIMLPNTRLRTLIFLIN